MLPGQTRPTVGRLPSLTFHGRLTADNLLGGIAACGGLWDYDLHRRIATPARFLCKVTRDKAMWSLMGTYLGT